MSEVSESDLTEVRATFIARAMLGKCVEILQHRKIQEERCRQLINWVFSTKPPRHRGRRFPDGRRRPPEQSLESEILRNLSQRQLTRYQLKMRTRPSQRAIFDQTFEGLLTAQKIKETWYGRYKAT